MAIESALNKIAERVLDFDEASLAALWEKYKDKMEHFEASKEWERSVVIFFLINSVRVKNHIFNEEIVNAKNQPSARTKKPRRKTELKLVKS